MVNFSPLSFLANPLMWMRAISKYRAIWTASPDFGYRLCTKRAANADISDIDLSCLVYCVAGVGQRCVPSLLREFAAYWAFHARLPDDGDRGIFVPNYGLAEHVVATCGENDGLVASRRRPDLTSCGSDFIINLCIVDSATRRILPSGMPGELWLSSSSIAKGYWGKPELSRETFRAQLDPDNGQTYLRTGDEAFIEDGHLFICGRIKDLIIIGGKNYYSDDVEFAATEAIGDAIRPGCVAAFSFTDDGEEEDECLCIVLEIRDERGDASECTTLVAALTTSVAKDVGLRPQRVVFIKQRTILKTSSGKLRRRAIRDALFTGKLRIVFDSNPSLRERRRSSFAAADDAKNEAGFTKWLSRMISSMSSFLGDTETQEKVAGWAPLGRPSTSAAVANPTWKWSECLLAEAQARGYRYEASDFFGVWEVLDDHYAIRRFHVKTNNVIDDRRNMYRQHHLGCGHFAHEARVIAKVLVTKNDVDVRTGVREDILAQLPNELYVLVIHTNGVVKFVPHTASSRLPLAEIESYDSLDSKMNLKHADKFGCFRFGIIVGDGQDRRLVRINRWATDNRYFWSAVNVTRDFPNGFDEPRELLAIGLASHAGVDGTTPPGVLRDTIIALDDKDDDRDGKRAIAARATAAIAKPNVDFLLAKPFGDDKNSFAGGLAFVERAAKQITSLFPPETSLKNHPSIPTMFRQLNIPVELERRLEHDESVADVASFVEAVKSNIVNMPVLLQVAQELETRHPGRGLPLSDKHAAADLRIAVIYCYALHIIGVSMIQLPVMRDNSDFMLEFLKAREAAVHRSAKNIKTSPFEIMKQDAISTAVHHLANMRHTRSEHAHAFEESTTLTDNIVMAAIKDVSNKFDRAGFELAYWSCNLQQNSARVHIGSSEIFSRVAEFVQYDVCPVMMSEWVQVYIVWNVSFGLRQPRPFLTHTATLLAPCLLALTNENPASFLWMRTVLLYVYLKMLEHRPDLKTVSPDTYDWYSTEMSNLLGELSEKLAYQLSTEITTCLTEKDRSERNSLGSIFANVRDRVLEMYQNLRRGESTGALGEGWLDTIRARVMEVATSVKQREEELKGNIGCDISTVISRVLEEVVNVEDLSAASAALSSTYHHVAPASRPTDALETAVRQAQHVYVQSTLLKTLASVVEFDIDPHETSVAHLGLSSQDALSVQQQLRQALAVDVRFNVLMDPDLSIVGLSEEILKTAYGQDASPVAKVVPLFDGVDLGDTTLPQEVVDVVQVLSLVLVVTLVSVALIPSYTWGYWVQWRTKSIAPSKRIEVRRENSPWSHIKVTSNVNTYGLLLPLIIPLFMVSLTTIAIIAKWVVIGRYRVGTTRRGTLYFLRWWFIDRLIDQFDLWVGLFIHDTLFINCFYVLMGAQVSPRARIKVLLREFDLFSIGAHATVSGAIFGRMFEPDSGLRFACVVVKPHAETKSLSVVMPECTVDHGTVLDHGSATMAGMQLTRACVYHSNPAQLAGVANARTSSPSTASWLVFELAKLMTLPGFLYGSFFASNVLLEFTSRQVDWYAWQFRYRELAYFVLAYYAAMFVSSGVFIMNVAGVIVILLKWAFIGRLRPGSRVRDDWTWRLRTWFVEWIWYRIVFGFGSLLWEENGLVSTALMKVLGMRVWVTASMATSYFFSPVEADLIEVGDGAQLSACTISCEGPNGAFKAVKIGAYAQVGLRSRLNAGVIVQEGAVVGHQSIVPADYIVRTGSTFFASNLFSSAIKSLENKETTHRVITSWVAYFSQSVLRAAAMFFLGFVALIPAYELGVLLFYGTTHYLKSDYYEDGFRIRGGQIQVWRPPVERTSALLLVGAIALVAYASLAIAFRIWQRIVLRDWKIGTDTPLCFGIVYMNYQHTCTALNRHILALLRGSRLANVTVYMRFFGAHVALNAFVNNTKIFEPPLLTVGRDAVIDDGAYNVAHVLAHGHLVFRKKKIGNAAILHPGSITWAGDVVPDGVILGPMAQLPSVDADDDSKISSFLTPGTYLQGCPAQDYTKLYCGSTRSTPHDHFPT